MHLGSKNLRLKIKRKGRTAKFYPRYIGSFSITKADPTSTTYKLELPPSYKIHPMFHASFLKPATANDPDLFPQREPSLPGPAFDNDDDEYEIEKILDHCNSRHRGREYLVHWLGYPSSDDQ